MNNIGNQINVFRTIFNEIYATLNYLGSLNLKINTIEDNIDTINDDIVVIDNEIININNDVTSIDGRISTINQEIDYINVEELNAVNTRLDEIDLHVGEYKFSPRSNDYMGWLRCDGRSISRTTYSALFQVIGTSFGSSDTTTFRLPDFRGRVFGTIGQGSNLTSRNLGDVIGMETHLLVNNEIPTHNHRTTVSPHSLTTLNNTNTTTSRHTHTITDPGHKHTLTINVANPNPTNVYLMTTTDSTNPNAIPLGSLETTTDATNLTIPSSGEHTHATTFSTLLHSAATSTSVGGGTAHNNMQPTLFGGNVFIYSGVIL